MGIAAAALVGASVYSAYSGMQNAKKQSKALAEQGALEAENKATQVKAMAASQKTSYLSSGLELEGTPMAVLGSTYATGQKDIAQIISNYNTQSKNIMSEARTKALTSLASMGGTLYSGGAGGGSSTSNTMSSTSGGSVSGWRKGV